MSLILRLAGVQFNNENLPKLISEIPRTNLDLLFMMDHDIANNVVIDDSGNGYHGVASGAIKSASGLSFDYGKIDTEHFMPEEHTIFAVVKFAPGERYYQFIASAYSESSQMYFRSADVNDTVNLEFVALHDIGTGSIQEKPGINKPDVDDVWVFFAMSTKANQQITFIPQFNVSLYKTNPSNGNIGASTRKTKFGHVADGNETYDKFSGEMAMVGIYNKAMNQDELSELYTACRKQMVLRGVTLEQQV